MNDTLPPGFLRRHPWAVLGTLLAAAVLLWIGNFLATFDLNQYRTQLVDTLSARLGMEVRLGDAHLELREGGVAFRFADVQLGSAQRPVEIRADRLWLQLAWHGLLLRKPVLTEVALDAPRVRISPPPPPPPADQPQPAGSSLELLRDLKVRRIEISRGALDVSWPDREGAMQRLLLDSVNVNLADLGLGQAVFIDGAAEIPGQPQPARLTLKGSVTLPETGGFPAIDWDLALKANALEATRIAPLIGVAAGLRATGSADLELFLKGTPLREMTVQLELTGTNLQIDSDHPAGNRFPVRHLQLAGVWQSREGRHDFRQVAVHLNDLRLAGEFSLTASAGGRQLTGRLSNSTLPVDGLRHLVPAPLREANPLLARRLPGGVLTLHEASLRAEIPADPHGFASFALETLHGEASELSWDLGAGRKAELKTLGLRLEDNRWSLEEGSGTLAGLPATLSASISAQPSGLPQFAIELAVSGSSEQFLALAAKPLPEALALTGELSLTARAAGTPEQYTVTAEADLSRLDLRYGEQLHLPPRPAAGLRAAGRGTRTGLAVDQASLVLPPLAGALTGSVDWSGEPAVSLTAELAVAELADAYELAPALRKLALRGGLALNLTLAGTAEALQPTAGLVLRDIAVPTHGIVADITQLNGRLLLEGKGLRSDKLTGRLGKSPVTLEARVADFAAPRLELDVLAASLRADELIFRSDRSYLRDVDGRLIFDRDGLQFAPVKVRLDGGTRATVSGSVRNFSNPQVELDISGSYARVGEIIGLWTDESPAAEKTRLARHAEKPHGPLPPIRIRVEAREGDLYGMKFSSARALIVPTSERLLIHPLDFRVGEGYCTTQVIVDFHPKTLIRVSGHAEDVDAYQVVNELLDRKSIMRGSLRGDFYLQGELGEGKFLPTSFGNISATVHNGVMRHSPVLATVFSLLNVSQLFAFKLPDVNSEGVPFSRLAAELAIDRGILSSDLIVIDSEAMNMSYIGKFDMVRDELDLLVVVKPLGTVDKVVTRLPVAGWILGGEEKALITAQFRVTGPAANPQIEAIPVTAISRGVLGLFQRTLGLPLKLIEDPAILWGGGGKKP